MVIAFVPVRIGSKGIPFKNIKDFCGKPLFTWTLETLIKCKHVDKIVLAYDAHAFKLLAPKSDKIEFYERSEANAQDSSTTESIMLEYINQSDLDDDDKFMLVQATNPFVTSDDFDNAIVSADNCSIMSVVESHSFQWREYKGLDGYGDILAPINYNPLNRPTRQTFDSYLIENGAFYISTVGGIKTDKCRISSPVKKYLMSEYSRYDIDTLNDWKIAEQTFKIFKDGLL